LERRGLGWWEFVVLDNRQDLPEITQKHNNFAAKGFIATCNSL
jgi:hypothetical protein